MKLHEYQSKILLKRYGFPVPEGHMASEVEDAVKISKEIGFPVAIKAQIHAGGRGKCGGIKLARNEDESRQHAREIIGVNLVTQQTGPGGKRVNRILVEKALDIAQELYVGITLDRSVGRLAIVVSASGGVDIEKVAKKAPKKILREIIDPAVGFQPYQGRKLFWHLGLDAKYANAFVDLLGSLYQAYIENDASLIEINPLIITKNREFVALDAKIILDDNALFRHKEFEEWRDITEEDPSELEAKRFGLNYVNLDGNVGCMVNGAGLAMATMDIIKLHGGEPANFLDVGGSATKENVAEGFKIILRDQKVKAIFINIFGGIIRCDLIAEGVIAAALELSVKVPIVVRLQGNNVELGQEMLRAEQINIIPIDDLTEAAKKVVELAKH